MFLKNNGFCVFSSSGPLMYRGFCCLVRRHHKELNMKHIQNSPQADEIIVQKYVIYESDMEASIERRNERKPTENINNVH